MEPSSQQRSSRWAPPMSCLSISRTAMGSHGIALYTAMKAHDEGGGACAGYHMRGCAGGMVWT